LLSKQEIISKLKSYGLKSTHQRIIIYEAIYQMKNHPSAELVYEKIKQENPSITLATVYNTLETFAASGLLSKVSSPNGKLRFDPNTSQHNHIYCLNTNDVYDFYDSDLEEFLRKFIASKKIENFEVTDFKLLVKGNKIKSNKHIKIT